MPSITFRSFPQPFLLLLAKACLPYPCPRGLVSMIRQTGTCLFVKTTSQEDLHFFKRRKKRQPSCAFSEVIAATTAKSFRHNGAVVVFWRATLRDLFLFLFAYARHLVLLSFFPFSFEKKL